jgi:hypothetical protein
VQWRWITEAQEGYPEPPARAVFSEIIVRQSAPGTLNVVTGFTGGFLGTQELTGPHERIVQFSLHDPPHGPPAEILDLGFGAEVKRWPFDIVGLTGTGSHAYVVSPIKEGEPLGLLVTAEKEKDGAVVCSFLCAPLHSSVGNAPTQARSWIGALDCTRMDFTCTDATKEACGKW